MTTILVVDDDQRMLHVVGMYLAMDGFTIVSAIDGNDALKRIEEQLPDLVIMDIMMPGVDGIEACTRIRANPTTSHIPVVLFTALSSAPDVERARLAGANHMITKPFNLVGLSELVRSLCSSVAGYA